MNKKNIIYLIVGIVLGAASVYLFIGNDRITVKNINIEEKKHLVEEEGLKGINIPKKVMKEFGIELQVAKSGKISIHKDLTGEIVPNPYNVAHIVPRFTGVVKAVYKKIGDSIKKGEKIATIESNESLVSYDVKSSINGTILEMHMTPGELIGDAQHIVMIANLKNVWAELNIYQQDLESIKVGQTVKITSPHSKTVYKGKLFYISPIVDEATRTAVTRVKLNNSRGIWKPGMFVSGTVQTDFSKVKIAVPKNAVQILNGEKVIFVKGDNGFSPRVVTLGKENGKYVEVLEGLHEGDIYVAKGAYTYKSEILKESFGGDEH